MRCSSQAFLSATKPSLQAQDISHGLRSFFLCRGGDVSIGIQGETGGEVTEHSADSLDVHTVLECGGGEGAPEVMKSDLRDTFLVGLGYS